MEKMSDDTALTKERQDWIDLVRFIAICIVCMNHLPLNIPGINYWGGMFFVPVFFVLSGWFFRPGAKRARRLLIPYFVTNIILCAIFLVRDIIKADYSGTLLRTLGFLYGRNRLYREGLTLVPVSGGNVYFLTALNSPMWFLPALFVTGSVFALMYRAFNKRENGTTATILLIVTILLVIANIWHYMFPVLLPWSIDALPFFLGFFHMGYLLAQRGFWERFLAKKWLLLILLIMLIAGGLLNGSANYSIGDYGNSVMLAYFNALTSSMLLMYFCYLFRGHIPRVLTLVGKNTLSILCVHYPVLMAMEAVRAKLLPVEGPVLIVIKVVEIAAAMAIITAVSEYLAKVIRKKRMVKAEKDTNGAE